MARPQSKGIPYFPVVTEWDQKMKLVRAKYKLVGVGCVVELWKAIYSEGYALTWDDDAQLMFADENSIDLELLRDIVEFASSRGLFDKTLLETQSVLTSHGIQKQWITVVRKAHRADCEIDAELCLLSDEERTLEKVERKPSDRSQKYSENPAIAHKSSEETPQSKAKQSKVKKACSTREADDTDIPEVASHSMPPAACPFVTVQEIKSACSAAPFQIRLSARDLEDIAARLSTECLDARFVAYVIERARDPSVKSPGAFARSALIGSGAFAAMPDEYRADQAPAKPAEPQRDPPPVICDECGAEVRHSAFASDAFCSNPECGAFWVWDNDFGWIKSEDRAVAFSTGTWRESVEKMEKTG